MNGSPSVRVALFNRECGSKSPCRWLYCLGIYNFLILSKKMKYNLPLLFGIIGIDAHLFKCYFNSNTLNIDLE